MNSFRLAAFAVSAAGAIAAPAMAHDVVYFASLNGANESPVNASPGIGFATITVNDDNFTVRVQATFSGLSGTTSAAHIHCCTTVAGAGTAGVATTTPSFVGFPLGVTAGALDMTYNMALASSWNPAYITANGGTTSTAFAAYITGIAAGKAYLNIHSTAFGGGEIRGFITAVPEPGSWALMLGGLAAVGAQVRRRTSRNS